MLRLHFCISKRFCISNQEKVSGPASWDSSRFVISRNFQLGSIWWLGRSPKILEHIKSPSRAHTAFLKPHWSCVALRSSHKTSWVLVSPFKRSWIFSFSVFPRPYTPKWPKISTVWGILMSEISNSNLSWSCAIFRKSLTNLKARGRASQKCTQRNWHPRSAFHVGDVR